ncbi:MAG: ATP-binding protein [Planctomycetota bacterium]
MIPRARASKAIRGLLRRHPVVAILGARQVGKTTLAQELIASASGPTRYFDLEDPADLGLLDEPMLTLRDAKGLLVIDEVQRRPELFPILRVLVDKPRPRRRFLILGSASPDLLQQSSESLAGRIHYFQLGGFDLEELGTGQLERLWLRGGFPRSFLAGSDRASAEWRRGFAKTFLQRDLPELGVSVGSGTMERFWAMLGHYHGQTWNASEFARAFGIGNKAVGRYLDHLTQTFMVRQLRPWHENLKKRQVKSPKVLFHDSGMLHTQLGLDSLRALQRHPKVGASWEGFALDCAVRQLGARPEECYFWATHAGAELDLLVVRGSRRLGFEFKRTEAPRISKSMRVCMQDLSLDRLCVVHAGRESYPLDHRVRALAVCDLLQELRPLR